MIEDNNSHNLALNIKTLKEVAVNFEKLVTNAERFLKPQPEQVENIHQLIQQTYGLSINCDVGNKKDTLLELVLEHMDDEQIWQQLELRNDLVTSDFLTETAKLTAIKEQNLGIELDEDENEDEEALSDEDEQGESGGGEDSEDEEDSDMDDYKQFKKKSSVKKVVTVANSKRGKKSVVDDTFFKLDELKQFLEQEDAKEMRKQKNKMPVEDNEGIDYFADDFGHDDDDDDVNVNYADFFDMDEELIQAQKQQNGKKKDFFNDNDKQQDSDDGEGESGGETEKEDEEEQPDDAAASEIDEDEFVTQSGVQPASDSDSDEDQDEQEDDDSGDQLRNKIATAAEQSSNELREARLLQRIRDYEEVVLGEKPWQLKGEVQAGNRPQNSLLEEILEFDSTTRPAAPITEEQNETIEDLIKQRIRDKAWDDVVRTVRPVHTPQEYRKQLVLDQEKSKQSLAQIYEKEYQREMDKLDPNRDADDSSAPEPTEHQEIRRAMRTLFLKLDALSNFHFTPKPVAPEVKIVTNTPAVNMEEVAPVAVSDAKLLAPEEVFRGPRHTPLGKTERTSTDKNRERRKKKQKQRAIHSALEKRELERAKEGKAPSHREANAKLLRSITKSRNVQKITNSNDQSALKSSKAFFNKLQDTTSSSATTIGSKRPKKDPSKANAKKLKL